jgi:NhaP-type Na+/H+ and K+/H+ antiporter
MIAWTQARAAPIIATILFGAPLLAFVLVIVLVKGHAGVGYYEAVSQIIPVVILALSIAAAGLEAGACALVAAILLPSGGGEAASPG